MAEYYIGIDGGGTKSTVLVSDGNTDLLYFETGGFNYNSFSKETIILNIKEIRSRLIEEKYEIGDCRGICIGSAGTGNTDAVRFLRSSFEEQGFLCSLEITGDEVTALKGAFGSECGILLISGTGSICYGQNENGKDTIRAGGYGHLIDDGGSAYAIGRDILHEVVMEIDGRKEGTILKDAVFDYLKISSVNELITYVYDKSHTKKDIAALAKILTEDKLLELAAVKGIIENASVELTACVRTVALKLQSGNEKIPLVLAGSTILNNKALKKQFLMDLSNELPQIDVVKPKQNAVHGAIAIISEISPISLSKKEI